MRESTADLVHINACRHDALGASFGPRQDFASDCWAAAEDAPDSGAPLADTAGPHCSVSGVIL